MIINSKDSLSYRYFKNINKSVSDSHTHSFALLCLFLIINKRMNQRKRKADPSPFPETKGSYHQDFVRKWDWFSTFLPFFIYNWYIRDNIMHYLNPFLFKQETFPCDSKCCYIWCCYILCIYKEWSSKLAKGGDQIDISLQLSLYPVYL